MISNLLQRYFKGKMPKQIYLQDFW